ncbi:hypothetical protein Tco_0209880 [Tanacetum coccineum]
MTISGAASYAFSDSLLLTPLCCDDIHDVTPRVSALAGCDRLVSEPQGVTDWSLFGWKSRRDRIVDRLSDACNRAGPVESGDSCGGKVKPKRGPA